jgi:hypothetical protein
VSVTAVAFYISGHGFGHASRQIEIINAFGLLRPDARIVVRTAADAWLFERTVRVAFELVPGACDTGVVQIDSLHLDEERTVRDADAFYGEMNERVAAEAELLRSRDVRLVVSDAPPLACAAAVRRGIPSIVIANFTWDWIYSAYAERLCDAPHLIPAIQQAYRGAAEAWRLPMHGGFETFGAIRDVPFVARHARHPPAAGREALGLPLDRPLVLSSFGAYGVCGMDAERLDCLDTYVVVVTERNVDTSSATMTGIHVLDERRLYDGGFRYEDLVAAVDAVVTKPGYGIISECIANETAMLYTSRGRFAEYDVLVKEMPRYLRCAFIDQASLLAGQWRVALDRLFALAPPPEHPATDGAAVIADRLSTWLESTSAAP